MTDATRICIAEFDGWTHVRVGECNKNWITGIKEGQIRDCIPSITIDYLRDVRARRFTPRQQREFASHLMRQLDVYSNDETIHSIAKITNATVDQVASAMEKVIKESGK